MKMIFTCLFVSVMMFGFAQQNTFRVRAFAPDEPYLYQLTELSDGSFIGLGNPTYNSFGVYLLKTDSHGAELASKQLYLDNVNSANEITKTSDGGCIICGQFDSKPCLIKLNADLSVQWQKSYLADNGYASAFTVLQTSDNGYLMTGSFSDANKGGTSGLLIKTDAQGDVLFSKSYFDYTSYTINKAVATSDGNYALMASATADTSAIYLVKIKPDGSILWAKDFFDQGTETETSSLFATSDGGLVITGSAYLPNEIQRYQMMMIKYSNTGTLLWSKTVRMKKEADIFCSSTTEDRDGGYIFCGGLDAYNNGNYDASYGYAVKTDVSGTLQWMKTFDRSQNGFVQFNKVITTSDSGYAVCGEGYLYDANTQNDDFGSLIYKFNNKFETCGELYGNEGTTFNFGSEISETVPMSDISVTTSDISIPFSNVTSSINNVCNDALPLTILSFNATLQNKSVSINWTTANEVNTSYFMVERSKNATSFVTLQQVTAKGNSSNVQSYSINDLQLLPGTYYYRLKEVDKDGKITYSSIVPITMLNNGVVIISPNPVQNTIRIVMQSERNTSAVFQVVDMKGTVLASQKTTVSAGRNEILIPAASLAKGVYMLKVMEDKTIQTIRFVKE